MMAIAEPTKKPQPGRRRATALRRRRASLGGPRSRDWLRDFLIGGGARACQFEGPARYRRPARPSRVGLRRRPGLAPRRIVFTRPTSTADARNPVTRLVGRARAEPPSA